MKKTSDFLKKAIELVEGQRQEDYGDKHLIIKTLQDYGVHFLM